MKMSLKSQFNQKKNEPASVLVLGEPATAKRIADQFQKIGLRSQVAQDPYRHWPADWNVCWDRETILQNFDRVLKVSGEGFQWIHPGTTAWAERPEWGTLAHQLGFSVIAPSANLLSFFANKLNFLAQAQRLGISTLVTHWDPMSTDGEVERMMAHRHQSFPFVLRSVKGGGRFGKFIVQHEETLKRHFHPWCDQLRRKQGEVLLFAERYIEGVRLISVPFVRFQGGYFQFFPFVDVSLQQNYEKLIEIAPASFILSEAEAQIKVWSQRLLEDCQYVGVGLFEYLVDGPHVFLLEGLPRLNTNFHLWESIAGTQACFWQWATLQVDHPQEVPFLRLSEGRPCLHRGMALKILARDPLHQLPQVGCIRELSSLRQWEQGDSFAEFDCHYHENECVTALDSGLIGLCFVFLKQDDCLQALFLQTHQVFLQIWIAGLLQTNERFLLELLEHPWLQQGVFHSDFIDSEFLPQLFPSEQRVQLALDLCQFLIRSRCKQQPEGTWKVDLGSRWVTLAPTHSVQWLGLPLDGCVLSMNQNQYQSISGWWKGTQPAEQVWIGIQNNPISAGSCQSETVMGWVRWGRWVFKVCCKGIKNPLKELPCNRRDLKALVTGRVHALLFLTQEPIAAHVPIVILESMGVLVPHALPIPVYVNCWKVQPEQSVQAGQILAEVLWLKPDLNQF